MQVVLGEESPGVPVVILIQNDELDLVFPFQQCQVIKTELAFLAASGAFHVNHFNDLARQLGEVALTTGFNQHTVALGKKVVRQWINFLLQKGLASRQLHQFPAQLADPGKYIRHRHLLPSVEGISSVAPVAAQIAARKPHEKARQARVCGLALDRFENFGDYHPRPAGTLGKRFSNLVYFT
jgi:hypothetical protein